MGCSAQDQIAGYKAINKKLTELNPKVDPVARQFAINNYWLNLENNIMTPSEKEVYKKLVEQTDGVASISHSDSKQTNVPLVFVKEIGNEYVVYLENGQNYTFAKGSVKSNPTKSGRTVVLPSMELTKFMLEFDKLVQTLKDVVNKPAKPIEYGDTKTRAEMQKEDAIEAARMLKLTNAELQKEIEKAKDVWGHIFVTNREGLLEKKEKNKKLVTKMKQGRLDLFMKIPEVAPIVKNENVKSYYDGINAVINSVLPTRVRYEDLLTFSETTIEQLMGDKPIQGIAGRKINDKNSVIISTGKVSDMDVDAFTEAWYLKDTEEGRRIARMQDEDLKYDTLANSKGFKVFKDKNQAEVAARLMNAIKNVNGAHALTHEMIHVGSNAFMRANPEHPATIKVMALYKEALDNKEYIKEVTGEDYWATSIDEFIAEALSNPVLIEQFNNTPTKYGGSRLARLFETLVDTLLGMLGCTKNDSVYQHVMDGFAAMLEYQSNQKVARDMEIKGSDVNTNIGQSATDVEEMGFDIALGQNLVDVFIDWYKNDLDAGTIASDKTGIFDVYVQTAEEFAASGTVLSEFETLQKQVLDTYMKTMTELNTGNMSVDMFTNDVEATAGSINLKTRELKVRWNKASRLTSSSEVLLHEVNHSMSHHVFAKNVQLKRLAEDLRNAAIDAGVDYTLFLKGIDNPTANEIEIAKMKFEYTFDKTANVEEFYAYATTNERVYDAIKDLKLETKLLKELDIKAGKRQPFKTALNILIKSVNEMWRMLSGRGVKGGQMIADMVQTIARLDAEMVQTKAKEDMEQEGLSAYASGKMNELDEITKPIVQKVADWTDKLQGIAPSKLGKHIAKIPVLNELMETGIMQYVWRAVTQDTTKEGVSDMYMVFRHSKQVVEKHTADIRNGVKLYATKLYEGVDEPTKNSVTKLILEADLAQFNAVDIRDMLNDEAELARQIDYHKSLIQDYTDKPIDKETMSQINGLATYMVDGTISKLDQQMNAHNIAHGLHIPDYDSKNKKPRMQIEIVDKLVSLIALQKSDSVHKTRLKALLDQDNGQDIVDKTVNMYRGYIDNMRADATVDGYDPVPKGYTKPANGLLRYELVPEDQIRAQESVLMKLVNEKPYLRLDGKDYYLMTGRTKSVGFTEGALGLISHTTEGIPVSSLLRKQNDMMHKKKGRLTDVELRKLTDKIIESIAKGDTRGLEMLEGKTLVPVYNHAKGIVDYRVQLNSLEKEIHLPDRETGLEDVLSSTFSRSVKTTLTASENKTVVDTIIKNSAQGVLLNPDMYILVEEYTEADRLNGVKREKRHDRWDNLPDHTKDYIFSRTRHKGILIHKDFVELMTGEKDMTIGNFAAFGFEMKQHPVARARLMAFESYLVEILKYVKQEMIVLDGNILVGNQVSNAIVANSHGIGLIEYTKKFKERWQQLNDYNEKVQMLAELEVEKMAGGKVDNKMAQLNKQLEGNIWDELVKDGQYTALVEDINLEEKPHGQLAKMLQESIDKSKYKEMITTVRDSLYITKAHNIYGVMLKTVHYGDAITRQIIKEELEQKMYARWAKKHNLGEATKEAVEDFVVGKSALISEYKKEKQSILNYLDQLLVNYGYIPNSWWNYAERVTGLLFMKYYLNQPKAIISMIKKSPTRIALMQGTQGVTGIDVADPFNTYQKSALDGLAYRWMLDDAPERIVEPNIFHLIPNISSIFTIR